MTDYRNRISGHSANDDWRHYEFTRRTGLPRGTFGRERDPDVIVWWACVALAALVVGLMVFGIIV